MDRPVIPEDVQRCGRRGDGEQHDGSPRMQRQHTSGGEDQHPGKQVE
jgi:hypothetical protein